MKLSALLAAVVFAAVPLLSVAPVAAAVDLCGNYGLCVPEVPPAPPGCGLNGYAVRTDCNGNVYVCTARYMGGGSPLLIGNFIWRCEAVAVILG